MSLQAVTHPSNVCFGSNHIVRWTGKVKHFVSRSAPLSLKFASDDRIRWKARGREFRLNPTTLLILDHGEPYEVHVDAPTPVSAAGIFFGDAIAALLDDCRPIPPRIIPISEANAEFVSSVLTSEPSPDLDEYLFAEAIDLVRGAYLTYEFQKESLELKREITSTEIMAALYRARDLILSSSGSPLTLDRIAQEAALSKYHFHRLFSTAFGQTCHEFLEATRLEVAMKLLETSQDSIDRIADQCGFPSGRALRLKFVRRYGLTPSAVRASAKSAR